MSRPEILTLVDPVRPAFAGQRDLQRAQQKLCHSYEILIASLVEGDEKLVAEAPVVLCHDPLRRKA